MRSLVIVAVFAGTVGVAMVPGVASADPTGNACTHIGTLGPGSDGQPATECQKVDDPSNPQQWVTIPDWLGHTHDAVGLKCTLVGGIPLWVQA